MKFNLFETFPFLTKTRLSWAILIAIVGMGAFFYTSKSSTPAPVVEGEQDHVVTLATLSELADKESTLSVLGTVSSRSQASLIAESQGRITNVYTELGSFVKAGSILAELDNARERAQVVQAKGAYDAAQATYNKISKSARSEQLDILGIGTKSAAQSLESAKVGAVNALLSAYAAIDDAVSKKTDENFDNPTSNNPQFLVSSASSQAVAEAANRRASIQVILTANSKKAQTLTLESDFKTELAATEADLRSVRTYLDFVAEALSRGIETSTMSAATISAYKADAGAARASVNGALSALAGAKENLNARTSALEIANKNLQVGETGGQSEDVLAALGSLHAAEGALLAANASYEKTVLRTPISGTVNSLTAKQGEFASPGKTLVTIANNDALEIIANVTEKERIYLQAGTVVKIDGTTDGVVTAISPALDPITKKVEVRISVPTSSTVTLTNGKTVRIQIPQVALKKSTPTIPITALKITPDGVFVFGVSEDDVIVALPVTIGTLRGSSIEITSALNPALRIITDVRGLKEGQSVDIR